ncbi:MAG TPA: FAD-dependent oxidoreductase [Micromonosporaceae bacterium]|jgi:thioredoxin reductase (NADPH)|nr:FAD-dependent oxidoreductase [Micromonosporaceae bacterium]
MSDLTVYGAPWCPDCRRAKKFLAEHRVTYQFVDIDEDADALAYVEQLQNGGRSIPTIVFPDGSHLVEPGNDELARKLGLTLEAMRRTYDLVIVGGGPTGLAAAIYAAREGIETLVVDKSGLGGQAGVTERIDNYPGFPDGVKGGELADRFIAQARRYGVELLSAVEVTGVERDGDEVCVTFATGQHVAAPAVLVATGSSYRRLGVPGEDDLIGAGVHFCATCDGPFYRGAKDLVVIGGGNSALEEGLFLTEFADHVTVLERGPRLRASKLLQDKVSEHPKMRVHLNTEITGLSRKHVDGTRLVSVATRDGSGAETMYDVAAAFVFIGLDPNSGWLGDAVALDSWKFVVTDGMFATSMPGVFAAGDVRAGATKQLGAAVGDGIAALIAIRTYLQKHSDLRRIDINA